MQKIILVNNLSVGSFVKVIFGGLLGRLDNIIVKLKFLNKSNFIETFFSNYLTAYSYKFKLFSLYNLYYSMPELVTNYFGPNLITSDEYFRYGVRVRRKALVRYVPRTVFNMPKKP